MDQEKYPSWKDALFSEDTVANIRCAIKYILWHTMYVLFAIVASVIIGAIKVVKYIAGSKFVEGVLIPLAQKVDAFFVSIANKLGLPSLDVIMERVADIIAYGMLILIALLFIASTLHDPLGMAMFIGIAISVVVAMFIMFATYDYINDNYSMHIGRSITKAKSTAVETPGVRRVYGECPVSFEMEPKWVQKIADKFEDDQ